MNQRLWVVMQALVLTVTGNSLSSAAFAQDATPVSPVSIEEQLRAQYKLAKVAGGEVLDAGTVLAIQKAGILAVSKSSAAICPSRYQDGDLHTPSAVCLAMVKMSSHWFRVGDKVYPSKIDFNPNKDKISFRIVACDSCNQTDPPSYAKSEVIFQFPKGSLEKTSVSQIEDTIGQVLMIDNSPPEPQQAQNAQAPSPQAPAQQPQQKAGVVELGQTPEQVQAILGQPERMANLGSKQIYFYKDMKVTFLNGKVTDVQ